MCEYKKIPVNIVVNKDAESVYEVIGISKRRADEIYKRVTEIAKGVETVTQGLEKIIAEFDGVELVYALYVFSALEGMGRAMDDVGGIFVFPFSY